VRRAVAKPASYGPLSADQRRALRDDLGLQSTAFTKTLWTPHEAITLVNRVGLAVNVGETTIPIPVPLGTTVFALQVEISITCTGAGPGLVGMTARHKPGGADILGVQASTFATNVGATCCGLLDLNQGRFTYTATTTGGAVYNIAAILTGVLRGGA